MGRFGFWELIIILVIILVIFGAGKLPQVMKSLGEGMRSFRKAAQEDPQNNNQDNSTTKSVTQQEDSSK